MSKLSTTGQRVTLGERPHNMLTSIFLVIIRVCRVIDRVATMKLLRRLNATNTSGALFTSA